MSAGTSYDRGAARQIMVTTALRLVAVSVAFGLLSGTVSVFTGLQDHSLGVFGIGLGVLADVTGSAVLVWRFRAERRQPMRSGTAETSAAVIVSAALAVVSLVLIIQSVLALAARSRPGTSSVTLIAAGVSLAVLAPLAVAKRRLGKRMSSRALQGDGALSGIGAATSLLALAALGLNDSLGWWWADRVAALVVAAVAAAEAWRTAGITRRLAQPFASTAKRTDGRLEEGQAGAHHLGVLRVAAPWTAFGFHRRVNGLQGSVRIGHPGPGVLIRGLLAQRIQALCEIIRAALDIGPASAGVSRRGPARGLGHAHRVIEGRALRVRVDDPRPPACRGRRAAACRTRDPYDHADQDHGAEHDPQPEQIGTRPGG